MTPENGTAQEAASQRPRPTMRDVARLAGVGTKTVSRVLNGEPNVSPQMLERVQKAATALNYQINLHAGNLRRIEGRTKTIGLLVGSVENSFDATIHRAIEDVMSVNKVAVFAASHDENPERERSVIEEFVRRRVDGLILATISPNQGFLHSEISRGTPIVFIDREANGISVDSVIAANKSGAATGARHLIAHGHRRIAYLGGDSRIRTTRDRHDGFREELARVGIAVTETIQISDVLDEDRARQVSGELLDSAEPPTAFFAARNVITVGVIRAIRERGLQQKVALIGFDDISFADLLEPGITVISQSPQAIGELAAQTLIRRMDGDTSPVETVAIETKLIERGSGEIFGTESKRHE